MFSTLASGWAELPGEFHGVAGGGEELFGRGVVEGWDGGAAGGELVRFGGVGPGVDEEQAGRIWR